MFYKTERQKRQILGYFMRQERQIEPFAMLTYFRHRDTHFEYIVKE